MRRLPRQWTLTTAAFTLAACGGSSDTSAPPACSVTAVSVSPNPGTIEVGASVQLTATISQQNCTGLTTSWSSSNAGVASVSATGQVTGLTAGGPVTITATVSGQSGSVTLTVIPPGVATVSLAVTYNSLATGVRTAITPTLRDAQGTVLTGRAITWTSSSPAVASVSQAGVVEGLTIGGPVTITAASEGKSGSVQLTVVSRYAYAFANDPSATAPYDASALSSYSTTGAPTTITRLATGRYSLRFRNVASGVRPTAVLTNAFGTNNATCKVESWNDNDADIVVTVACRIGDILSDQQFFVTLFGADAFPGRFGFTWADQETNAGPYAPIARYAFNAAGQPIQIRRVSLGNYRVTFSGNGQISGSLAETFQVMAYGAGIAMCEVVMWTPNTAEVDIRCGDHTGAAIDSRFVVVMIEAGRPGVRHALAWVQCGGTSCTPFASFQRSTGGTITVNRLSIGRYDVLFPGLRRITGTDNVLVTSFGQNGGFCKLISIGNTGTNDLTAGVQCFHPGGSVGDRHYNIAVVP